MLRIHDLDCPVRDGQTTAFAVFLKGLCQTVNDCGNDVKSRLFRQGPAQQLQIVRDLAIRGLQFLDPAHTVHDGRVVTPPKSTTNFR